MKGYKVFNPDWMCRDFQYEVGKIYEIKGKLAVGKNGFHFCKNLSDCFDHYTFDSNNRVAEIEALGDIEIEEYKSATNKIKIVREIPWHEVLDIVNKGKSCTGIENTGYFNSGHYNIGNHNSGCFNIGNYNSGDFNSSNNSNGIFNTNNPTINMFNKPTNLTLEEARNIKGIKIFSLYFENTELVDLKNMSKEEKEKHPECEIMKGYYRNIEFKKSCMNAWNCLTTLQKKEVKKIPNFDADIFKEITGIDVNKD